MLYLITEIRVRAQSTQLTRQSANIPFKKKAKVPSKDCIESNLQIVHVLIDVRSQICGSCKADKAMFRGEQFHLCTLPRT